MSMAAGIKFTMIMVNNEAADRACASIKGLKGLGNVWTPGVPDAIPTTDGAPIAGGTPNDPSGGGRGGTSGGGGGGGAPPEVLPEDAEQFGAKFAAMTAGETLPPLKALNKLFDGKDLHKALAASGSSVKAVNEAIAAGNASALTADIGAKNARVADLIEEANKSAKEFGAIAAASTPTAAGGRGGGGGGGGGGSGGAAPNFAGLFGAKTPGGPGGEMAFDKKKAAPVLSDGDVFHASFKGSIFQIVSKKLEVTRERVDQLEWISPLNRALAGMKQLRPGESNVPKKVPVIRGKPVHSLSP